MQLGYYQFNIRFMPFCLQRQAINDIVKYDNYTRAWYQ